MNEKAEFCQIKASGHEENFIQCLRAADKVRWEGGSEETAKHFEKRAAISAAIYTACKLIAAEEAEAEELREMEDAAHGR